MQHSGNKQDKRGLCSDIRIRHEKRHKYLQTVIHMREKIRQGRVEKADGDTQLGSEGQTPRGPAKLMAGALTGYDGMRRARTSRGFLLNP